MKRLVQETRGSLPLLFFHRLSYSSSRSTFRLGFVRGGGIDLACVDWFGPTIIIFGLQESTFIKKLKTLDMEEKGTDFLI
jgi:hypothetical protein